MRKPIRITTPFPTTEEVARMMGVSPARTKEIQEIVAAIVERRRNKESSAARKAARNGGATIRKRSAPKALVS
jgi:hypothetical protein